MSSDKAFIIKYHDTDLSKVKVFFSEDEYEKVEPAISLSAGRIFGSEYSARWYLDERIKIKERAIHLGDYEANLKEINRLKEATIVPLTLTLTVGS